jgi:hypothetical protein
MNFVSGLATAWGMNYPVAAVGPHIGKDVKVLLPKPRNKPHPVIEGHLVEVDNDKIKLYNENRDRYNRYQDISWYQIYAIQLNDEQQIYLNKEATNIDPDMRAGKKQRKSRKQRKSKKQRKSRKHNKK